MRAKLAVFVAVVGLSAVIGISTAAAATITFSGQGTNQDGTCGSFEGSPPAPGTTQTWQFNLTQSAPGATMSATFSDGTTVTNIPTSSFTGKTSKWLIVTAAGASVTSATATYTADGPNSQFVVSHCTAGGTVVTTTTTSTSTTTTTTKPGGTTSGGTTTNGPGTTGAAPVIVAAPAFTG